MKKLIAITNDDGIQSPGIYSLAESVMGLADIVIMAPEKQQTSMGRSLDGKKEDYFRPVDFEVNGEKLRAYQADCTPAMIVMFGMDILFAERKPDLILSGINYGENMATNITTSGTIGAAIQSAAMGVPAIAVSLQTDMAFYHKHGDVCWKAARHFTRRVVKTVLDNGFPEGADILNLNIPEGIDESAECRVTRQSSHQYFRNRFENPTELTTFGEGKCVIEPDFNTLEKDSDIYALAKDKVVSVTPLKLDMTADVGDFKID